MIFLKNILERLFFTNSEHISMLTSSNGISFLPGQTQWRFSSYLIYSVHNFTFQERCVLGSETSDSPAMAADHPVTANTTTTTRSNTKSSHEKRHRSIFEVPSDFFDSSRLLPSPHSSVSEHFHNPDKSVAKTLDRVDNDVVNDSQNAVPPAPSWTCNTCKAQFESLQDQRSHFKSDIHRFNVRMNPSLFIIDFHWYFKHCQFSKTHSF